MSEKYLIDIENVSALAYTAFMEASMHDKSIGGEILVATVRPGRTIEILKTKEELKKYHAAWYTFNGELKKIFRSFS